MKVVILSGGFGTRLSEETERIPKPMIQIGDKPILWHIMKNYGQQGFNEFIILGGYKCYVIKEYFANYFLHQSDVVFDLATNSFEILSNEIESWKVTVIDTGINTMTGGRLKRVEKYLKDETFMITYGDGLSNVDINKLISFHKSHRKAITMTAVQPDGRFGALEINDDALVCKFMEKPKGDGGWINGGFFVCEPKVFDYIDKGDETIWERSPLESLSQDGELYAFKHYGFWKPMDILRDKIQLENMWNKGIAPWKNWI